MLTSQAPEVHGWRAASNNARDLHDAADLILRLCEECEDADATPHTRIDKNAVGDLGYALGIIESRSGRLVEHLNRVVAKLNDKDSR